MFGLYLETIGKISGGVLGDLSLQPFVKGVVKSVNVLGELSSLARRLGSYDNTSLRKSFRRCTSESHVSTLQIMRREKLQYCTISCLHKNT